MNGISFSALLRSAFQPFLNELGFVMEAPLISGRYYRSSFIGERNVVSVSYEPGDEAVIVAVFSKCGSEVSDFDDRSKTLLLSDLNRRYQSQVTESERLQNDLAFQCILVEDQAERVLLKAAKELRLLLPRYLFDNREALN
jgi:hypothetical protein